MAEDNVKAQMRKGILKYCILAILSREDSYAPKIIAELKKLGREDIIVIVGGVIPAQDYDELYRDGAAAIFGPGTPIATAAIKIMEILLDEQK